MGKKRLDKSASAVKAVNLVNTKAVKAVNLVNTKAVKATKKRPKKQASNKILIPELPLEKNPLYREIERIHSMTMVSLESREKFALSLFGYMMELQRTRDKFRETWLQYVRFCKAENEKRQLSQVKNKGNKTHWQ